MRILFICAGNIVRSVIAECVLQARSAEILGGRRVVFTCESGGLSAEAGSPPHPRTLHALDSIGVPALEIAAAAVDEQQMRRADLALTMTPRQCSMLTNRFLQFKDKCFSLIGVNGAIETVLQDNGVRMGEHDAAVAARALPATELEVALDLAASTLRNSRRELLRPLKGVPLDIRDLLTLFPSCYQQVSGIHDPLGGPQEEMENCARQIEREVTELLYGLLALATSRSGHTLQEDTGRT